MRRVVSVLTMDVQGAFDALLRRRLLRRLRQQGWDIKTLRLIDSFLTDRRVQVRLDGVVTSPIEVDCGTPQGSPWSPIIYLLYLAELLLLRPGLAFGYADDLCVTR